MADTAAEKRRNDNGVDEIDAHERGKGIQVLWQNCKNDLVAARLDAIAAKKQLTAERNKTRQMKDQVTDLLAKISSDEDIINNFKQNMKEADNKMAELKDVVLSKDVQIAVANKELSSVKLQIIQQKREMDRLKKHLAEKCSDIVYLNAELKSAKEQLVQIDEKIKGWPYYLLSRLYDIGSKFSIFDSILKLSFNPMSAFKKFTKLFF